MSDVTPPGYGTGPVPPGAYAPPAPPQGQYVLASWGSRVGGALLDGLIVFALVVVLFIPLAAVGLGVDTEAGAAALVVTRRGRQCGGAAGAPRSVRAHGRSVHGDGDGRLAAAGGAAEQRRGGPKGPEDLVAAHAVLLDTESRLNFVGNVEGFAIGTGEADVIVTDGFTGNVALKVMEGTSAVLLGAVREAATSSKRSTIGGLMLRPALRELRDQLDPQAVGGAVLLGLRKLVVVPHGSFEAAGITNAIRLAARGVREDVVGRTLETLAGAGALRRVPAEVSAVVSSVPDQP